MKVNKEWFHFWRYNICPFSAVFWANYGAFEARLRARQAGTSLVEHRERRRAAEHTPAACKRVLAPISHENDSMPPQRVSSWTGISESLAALELHHGHRIIHLCTSCWRYDGHSGWKDGDEVIKVRRECFRRLMELGFHTFTGQICCFHPKINLERWKDGFVRLSTTARTTIIFTELVRDPLHADCAKSLNPRWSVDAGRWVGSADPGLEGSLVPLAEMFGLASSTPSNWVSYVLTRVSGAWGQVHC